MLVAIKFIPACWILSTHEPGVVVGAVCVFNPVLSLFKQGGTVVSFRLRSERLILRMEKMLGVGVGGV